MSRQRSYVKDFLAGVDPTGTKTFQYGMSDAKAPKKETSTRRAIGTAGGLLGGSLAVPSVISGLIGGGSGLASGGLRGAASGFVKGLHKPFSMPARAFRSQLAFGNALMGKQVSKGGARSVASLLKDLGKVPAKDVKKVNPKIIENLPPQALYQGLTTTRGELGKGLATLGLSGGIGGTAAYLQYGKGHQTGKKMSPSSRSRIEEEETEKKAFVNELRGIYQRAPLPGKLGLLLGIPAAGAGIGSLAHRAIKKTIEPSNTTYQLEDLKRALNVRGIHTEDENDPMKSRYMFKTKTVHAPEKTPPEFMAHELAHAKVRQDYPRMGRALNIARRVGPAVCMVTQINTPVVPGAIAATAGEVPKLGDEAYASFKGYQALKESGKYNPEELAVMKKNLIKAYGSILAPSVAKVVPGAIVSSMAAR